MLDGVQLSHVKEQPRFKEGQSNRKRFRQNLVSGVVVISLGYQTHFFRGEVGELLFEGSFLVVGFFVGPGKDVGDFDLSLFVDEDVVRPDISDFSVDGVEVLGTADQTI